MRSKEVLSEVEHVKALRNEKEKQHITLLEKFVTGFNEQAAGSAKERAMFDG